MGTKTQILHMVALFCCAAIFTKCDPPRFDCSENKYTFLTTISAYQDKDSIRVGDTIWFEANIPSKLIDTATRQLVDYSNAGNMGIGIGFVIFNGLGDILNPGVSPAADSFYCLLEIGNALPNTVLPEQNRNYSLMESNNQYSFRLGVVPKKRGIYLIGAADAPNVYRKSDACTKAYFAISFLNTNQHLYYIEQNRPGYIQTEFDKAHAYCMKVY